MANALGRTIDVLLAELEEAAERVQVVPHKTALSELETEEENSNLRELCKTMFNRLAWADEVLGGGVLDARMVDGAKRLGIEVER